MTIAITERSEALAVTVSDNGPGIPDEDISRIFDRFYRSVGGEEARSDSSGLGLAIVKRILDLHGSRKHQAICGRFSRSRRLPRAAGP